MRRFNLLIMAIAVFVQACNPQKGTIEPSELVPASVIASIKEKYPTATAIKFSVLEKDKVYQSEFKVDGVPMSVVTNNQDILRSSRLAGGNFRDSLQLKLKGLAIEGGVFSNYRVVETPGMATQHVTDYFLNGINYTLNIFEGGSVYMNTSKLLYETKSFDDLPEKIQKFVNDRNKPNPEYISNLPSIVPEEVKQYFIPKKELAYKKAAVYVLPNGTKRYHVYMEYYGIDWNWDPLIFDQNANLIWVAGYDQLEVFRSFLTTGLGPCILSDTDKTYFKDLFKTTQELNGFTFEKSLPAGGYYSSNTDASLNAYSGVKGYDFQLFNPNNRREFWHLKYDVNKSMIDRYYFANP